MSLRQYEDFLYGARKVDDDPVGLGGGLRSTNG